MAREPVFIDTWALVALINGNDAWHPRAVELSRDLTSAGRPLLTTEWILTEFLGGAARAPLRPLAVQSVRQFCASPRVEVIAATHDDWEQGFTLFESRPDKTWSLVDCISILICQRRAVSEVFTGDHHFEQAGLRILMRRSS